MICMEYLSYLDDQMPVSQIRQKFPFAQYSATNWMEHVKPVETEEDVQKSIWIFSFIGRHLQSLGSSFRPRLAFSGKSTGI